MDVPGLLRKRGEPTEIMRLFDLSTLMADAISCKSDERLMKSFVRGDSENKRGRLLIGFSGCGAINGEISHQDLSRDDAGAMSERSRSDGHRTDIAPATLRHPLYRFWVINPKLRWIDRTFSGGSPPPRYNYDCSPICRYNDICTPVFVLSFVGAAFLGSLALFPYWHRMCTYVIKI